VSSNTPTIAEQADTVLAGAAAAMPAHISGAFAADQAALDAAGVPADVVPPGTALPDVDLLDATGATTSLARLRGQSPAVVVFYRGAWCPYCNIALRAYQTHLVPVLAERGFTLIAVSPQKPDESARAIEINDVTFTVASDPGNRLAAALGILSEPSADSIAAQLELGLDLAKVNADGGRTLPMPTVLVVDAAGIIRWIDVHPNYASRTEVSDIVTAVAAVS
jgi:peroxiredoxin